MREQGICNRHRYREADRRCARSCDRKCRARRCMAGWRAPDCRAGRRPERPDPDRQRLPILPIAHAEASSRAHPCGRPICAGIIADRDRMPMSIAPWRWRRRSSGCPWPSNKAPITFGEGRSNCPVGRSIRAGQANYSALSQPPRLEAGDVVARFGIFEHEKPASFHSQRSAAANHRGRDHRVGGFDPTRRRYQEMLKPSSALTMPEISRPAPNTNPANKDAIICMMLASDDVTVLLQRLLSLPA